MNLNFGRVNKVCQFLSLATGKPLCCCCNLFSVGADVSVWCNRKPLLLYALEQLTLLMLKARVVLQREAKYSQTHVAEQRLC
jgi:hypothetical protein